MKASQEDIIIALYRFINEHNIDIVRYNLNNVAWWEGRKAILTKKYVNFCGEVIEKETMVCILSKMQYIHFGEVIHAGLFYVSDLETNVSIGGIDYNDLILTGEQIEIKDSISDE